MSTTEYDGANDFHTCTAKNISEGKSLDLKYSCCPNIRAKILASPMYLGVHEESSSEMKKIIWTCTKRCEIMLYERPTFDDLTQKYELILWVGFRDTVTFCA